MRLKLHHCPNPDIAGGYYETPVDPAAMTIEVNSVADASREYRKWIERNGLGGGNLPAQSGNLHADGSNKPFACVSYNGNVWSMSENMPKIYDAKTQLAETNLIPDGWKWA